MSLAAAPPAESALPAGVRLRDANDSDLPFLRRVYIGTRLQELSVTGWDPPRIEAFLGAQFQAQHAHYREHYADAEFSVIERGGEPIGRLYLHRRPGDWRIVDIALLPESRGAGLGTALLRAVIARATSDACDVSIHVEQTNPALALYLRLGFVQVGEQSVYHLLKRPRDA